MFLIDREIDRYREREVERLKIRQKEIWANFYLFIFLFFFSYLLHPAWRTVCLSRNINMFTQSITYLR